MRLSAPVKNTLLFLTPFALWCFLYRSFLWGNFQISEDTFAVFALVKYSLSGLVEGVFPHWNPYTLWGMGQICQFGEFNPIWLLTILLHALHVDFYHAFLWTMAVYFFIGALGVYGLFKQIFKDRFLAYFGFVCFLFSGVGMTIFVQVTIILIFIPAIWFFYLFFKTLAKPSPSGILFTAFALMLIANTYIPFYFLTTLIFTLFLSIFIYPRQLKEGSGRCLDIVLRHPRIFWGCVGGLVVACAATIVNWWTVKGHFVVSARPTFMDYAQTKDSGLPLLEVLRDPSLFSIFIQNFYIAVLTHARELFTLDNIAYDNQRIFYVPLIVHMLVLFSLWVRLNKRMLFGWLLCFILFLIAVTQLTPVYKIVFNLLPYFHLFRNIFLLAPFITVIYIMVMLEQFRSCWFQKSAAGRGWAVWAVAVAAYFLFLYYPFDHLKSPVVVCVGFLFLAIPCFLGRIRPDHSVVLAGLVALAMVQPIEVFQAHARQFQVLDSATIKSALSESPGKPPFNYVRPAVEQGDGKKLKPNDIYRLYNWHIIKQEDSPGFLTFEYGYPTRWSYALAKSSEYSENFKEYSRHKFMVYPQFQAPKEYNTPEEFLTRMSIVNTNGRYVDAAGPQLAVSRFDANTLAIKTNFSEPVFWSITTVTIPNGSVLLMEYRSRLGVLIMRLKE